MYIECDRGGGDNYYILTCNQFIFNRINSVNHQSETSHEKHMLDLLFTS